MDLSFAQIKYSLQIVKGWTVNSGKTLALALGHSWPPPNPSLRLLLSEAMSAVRGPSGFMNVTSVAPPDEPGTPRTTNDLSPGTGYVFPPRELAESLPPGQVGSGRLNDTLRQTAQLRDGNAILRRVADTIINNTQNPGTAVSQVMLTAMTQLAATGSNAFAAWAANPTHEGDLTSYLAGKGMDATNAARNSKKIMADFDAARLAVRTPRAGVDASSLRAGIGPVGAVAPNLGWIAVSGEDDPPDYPVNVVIAPYPQFHYSSIVDSVRLDVRYIIASSQGQSWETPVIPPGNEVILFIHGEGSRAEEALDVIPALHSAERASGRDITVIALDLPGSNYTTRLRWAQDQFGTWRWIRETPVHTEIAPMPNMSTLGPLETSSFAGTPILDFVEHTITAFVEQVIVPFGNPIKAIVGGSLGGHMGLRFAASQKPWVRNVVAWSPASVWEKDLNLHAISIPHWRLTDPRLAGPAKAAERVDDPPSGGSDSRRDFFHEVWEANVFPPEPFDQFTLDAAVLAAAAIEDGLFSTIVGLGGSAVLATVLTAEILALPAVPPQATQWYRDGWPSKGAFMDAARFDRMETYNTNLRQWHYRLAAETIGYNFDTLAPSIQKPLLFMVGEKDDYPQVHILGSVTALAGKLAGPGQALTVRDTGHSIQSERPSFLAAQILRFAR